jgi:hypothetical protein
MRLRWFVVRAILGAAAGWLWGRAEIQHWIPHGLWLVVSLAGIAAIAAWTVRGLREINHREREANDMIAHLRRGTKAPWN